VRRRNYSGHAKDGGENNEREDLQSGLAVR